MFLSIKGEKGLVKDSQSKAIICNDQIAYKKHLKNKESFYKKQREIDVLRQEVCSLREELNFIKKKLEI